MTIAFGERETLGQTENCSDLLPLSAYNYGQTVSVCTWLSFTRSKVV